MSPSKLFLSTGRLSRHFPPTRMSPSRKKSTFYGYDKLAISLMLMRLLEVDPGLDVVFDRLYSVQISDWPVVESMNFPHLTLLQQGTAVWSWVWFRHCVWQAPMKHRDASVQIKDDWPVVEEMDFPRLTKLNLPDIKEAEDLWVGCLETRVLVN